MLKQYFQTKVALGGEATIVLVLEDGQDSEHLFATLWHQVYSFERQFSRFLPGSELSVFNRHAGSPQFITAEFRQLLVAALEMAELSDGLYNPFILPALQRAGYKQSALAGYEHNVVDDHSGKAVATAEQLKLEGDKAWIPYGTAIDMGGCGKGYLADQLADTLDNAGADGYWISLSGDMVVAGHDEHGQPWPVTIQSADPAQAELPLIIQSTGQRVGVATSGTFRRPGQPNKGEWHHIIDPRTLQPAQTDVLLATVVHDSGLHADVLASCAVIVGSTQALPFLKARRVQAAVLQQARELTQFGKLLKTPQEHHA